MTLGGYRAALDRGEYPWPWLTDEEAESLLEEALKRIDELEEELYS